MNSIRDNLVQVAVLAVSVIILDSRGACPAQVTPKPPVSREFNEKYANSLKGRPLVEEAIAIANTLIGPGSPFVLQASWVPAEVNGKTIIPVFLGMPLVKESNAIAFVPDGEKCIIVEDGELSILDTMMGNGGEHAVKQPPATCLTIVLLHEIGHIALKHSGRMDGTPDKFVITPRVQREAELDIKSRLVDAKLAMKQANMKSAEKKRELAADAFVAKQIKDAGNDNAHISRWVKAKTVGVSLSMVCFNLGTARMLKSFEVDNLLSVNRNTLYWDTDDEHPNFEYRMLLINSLLATDTEAEKAAQALVEDFVARQGMIENGLILPRVKTSK